MQNMNKKIVTLFSCKGFGQDELFGQASKATNEVVHKLLADYFVEKNFDVYLKTKVFDSEQHIKDFLTDIVTGADNGNFTEKQISRSINNLKNINTAKKRKEFLITYITCNKSLLEQISKGAHDIYELESSPYVFGIHCLESSDTSGLWIPTLIRCALSLCKEANIIQLVLHDKDVQDWKSIRTNDVSILAGDDSDHFIHENAYIDMSSSDNEEWNTICNRIDNKELEIHIVFFHHTQNRIAKIVGNKPQKDADINTEIYEYISTSFQQMQTYVSEIDRMILREKAILESDK